MFGRARPWIILPLLLGGCEDEPLDLTSAVGGSAGFGAGGHAGDASFGQAGSGESGAGGEAGEGERPFERPEWLSETGLYSDIPSDTLAPGVRPFTPQYQLWSDGAEKRRWLKLPQGEQIDTSDMNYWRYPIGTKVWKEFVVEGRRIETRLLQKLDSERWFMMAFRWNAEATDAVAVPDGEMNARSKQHDVPSTEDCATCHENMPDVLLGVTALQLSHAGDGVTLDTLIAEGALSEPPSAALVVPGTDVEREALGYLHANCGVCHQPQSLVSAEVDMELWLRSDELDDIEDTGAYRTAVGRTPVLDDFPEATARIEPGDAEHSAIFLRMNSRDPMNQMPPLATEQVDANGVAAIMAWIDELGE